ncbi:hypothetical protein D5086_015752 [Populus alba]|uniref:Uncharacterized protein n=1 Tax=Populus alba TaxID=43335 RepID=A0ACC4BS32_POPAL
MFVIRKVSDVIQQPPGSFEVEIPQDPVATFRRKSQNLDIGLSPETHDFKPFQFLQCLGMPRFGIRVVVQAGEM